MRTQFWWRHCSEEVSANVNWIQNLLTFHFFWFIRCCLMPSKWIRKVLRDIYCGFESKKNKILCVWNILAGMFDIHISHSCNKEHNQRKLHVKPVHQMHLQSLNTIFAKQEIVNLTSFIYTWVFNSQNNTI